MLKTWLLISAALALAACTEKPQTVVKKGDTPAWHGASNGYVAEGWKVGDQKSWEAQMKTRAASQDEYARTQSSN